MITIARPGEEREKRRGRDVPVSGREHRSPLRRRRVLRAEAQEPEPGDVDDRRRHGERPGDDHRRDRVREDVARQDRSASGRRSIAPRGRSRPRADRGSFREEVARRSGPFATPTAIMTGTRPAPSIATIPIASSRLGMASRMSIKRITTRVGPAAEVAGDRAEQHPDREPDGHGHDADDERVPGAVDDARELVAAELVDAEADAPATAPGSIRSRAASRFWSVGECGASSGAKIATRMKTPTNATPMIPAGLRRKRRNASRHSPPVGCSCSSATSSIWATDISSP